MANFWSTGFWTPSFWSRGFWGDQPVEQSASSGIRRLQMYQMQEEALLKDAVNEAVAKVLPTKEESNERKQGQATPTRARKAKARKPAVVAREEYPEVRFKRKPIYTTTTDVNPTLPVWLAAISTEVDQWYASIIPLWKEHRQVIISKQIAANDADYRLRLLLLLAA